MLLNWLIMRVEGWGSSSEINLMSLHSLNSMGVLSLAHSPVIFKLQIERMQDSS